MSGLFLFYCWRLAIVSCQVCSRSVKVPFDPDSRFFGNLDNLFKEAFLSVFYNASVVRKRTDTQASDLVPPAF